MEENKQEKRQEEVQTKSSKKKKSCEIGPLQAKERQKKAYKIREKAALVQKDLPLSAHLCNGDEDFFSNKIGNYSKGLPHNSLGEVDLNAYKTLIECLTTGNPATFESIPLGGTVKLTNPQSAYAFDLVSPDSHSLSIIAPPKFNSAWIASEMAELYWQALTRDIPFADYDTNMLTRTAALDLSNFSDFRGPKENGVVTPGTLFRGNTPGDLVGPYISQFLWKNIPYGATTIVQRNRTTLSGDDHMTSYEEWLNIQNGKPPKPPTSQKQDPELRYIRNGRDLSEWVHRDFSYQCVLNACLILLSFGQEALDPANPYLHSKTQVGFATFGGPHILDLVARSANAALKAAWFQKWLVHRHLRPEEFGGHVRNNLIGASSYPIHQELLNSEAISHVHDKFETYLLPQAYPEGSPTHPAYPSGHASLVGAGVTILKAFFNESFVIPYPVVARSDGRELLSYSGSLTIGGELNKLASNITLGRNFAGIHWRSDGTEGMNLGEAVAIRILQDYKKTYNENFSGFSLTKFDGSTIII